MAASDEERARFGKVIARAWRDNAFKAKLLRDPQTTLAEAGIDVPKGVNIKVVEDTETTRHLLLPVAPEGELPDDVLEKIAGGDPGHTHGTPFIPGMH